MRRTRLARALYSGVHALLSSAWRLSLIGKQTELEVISSLALLQKSNFFLCEEKFVCKKKKVRFTTLRTIHYTPVVTKVCVLP